MKKNTKRKERFDIPFYELEIVKGAEKFSEKLFEKLYLEELKKFSNGKIDEENEYIFRNIFDSRVKYINNNFPEYILNKIPDVRLIALGKIDEKNYRKIDEFLQKKSHRYAYMKEYNKIKDKLPKDVEKELHLHDCLITDVVKDIDKYTIYIDCSQGIGNISGIIFENYEIVKDKNNIINSLWIDEEIYITKDNKYQVHILLSKNKLYSFIIKAENIKILK